MAAVVALAIYAITNVPPGVQGDEAFFLVALRRPETTAYSIEIPGLGLVSLMVNSYVGTIKAAIVGLMFRLAGPSIGVLRVFGIAALAFSGFLFFQFVRRYASLPLALATTAALLFDPAYFTTAVLDWGPVALQHVFLLMTLLAMGAAVEHASGRWAFAAGVSAGLGVWDKALFLFPLLGLITALLLLSILRRRWRPWRLALPAVLGAALGAAPFLLSVVDRQHGAAVGDLAQIERDRLPLKTAQMIRTMDGTVLRSFLSNTGGEPASIARGTRTLLPALSSLAVVVLFPVVRSRYGQFALATLAGAVTAWLASTLVRDVSISAHHTILFWPAPYLFALFVGLAWLEKRSTLGPAIVAVFALAALQNVRTLHELRQSALNHGYAANWTDAQYPLASRLLSSRLPGSEIVLGDWGLLEPMYLASGGALDLRMITDVFWKDELDAADRQEIAERMQGFEQVAIVYRVAGEAFFPGVRPVADQVARECGFTLVGAEAIADHVGAPRFEIVTYRRP